VDLLGCYSKQTLWTKRVSRLPETTAGDHAAAVRRARAVVTTLSEASVAKLVDGYRDGAGVNELATRFGIHRATVAQHLHRSGVAIRRRGLDADQIDETIRLYQRGWSLARLGTRMGVNAETIRQALLARGVRLRAPWERG
jgi:lambda repressor-like predicted transcriptional regulator